MARDETAPAAAPQVLASPQVSLVGDIDKFSVERFLDQLHAAEKAGGDVAVEVTTLGGDPEMARRIVLETQYARARISGRLLFLGKTVVYSAGITIMCGFCKEDRWLAHDTMLMIHGRKLDKTVEISGPIRTSLPQLQALQAQIETGIALEDENFRKLIDGSDVSFEEISKRSLSNWYLPAEEAVKRGLAAEVWKPV